MAVLAPMSVLLGFLLPGVFVNLRPFVPWLFGLTTLGGALSLRAAELGSAFRSPIPIITYFISARILMPLLALIFSSFFFGNAQNNSFTITGYILLFSCPAAISSFIWTTIFRGDKALTLALILIDNLLAPLLVPGTVSVLMGTKVVMDMSGIAISLILMIVIPTIIGVTINETSRGKISVIVSPYLGPISKICLMLVITTNASVIAPGFRFNDPAIWRIAVLVIILTSIGFLLFKLITIILKCNYEKSVSLIFSGGLRNISAVATIAVSFFPQAVVLPVLFGIMFQHPISALMGKLLIKVKKRNDTNF